MVIFQSKFIEVNTNVDSYVTEGRNEKMKM